jgi:hypothetical protein
MSVNDLLVDNPNKGWANLHVNSLQSYGTIVANKVVTPNLEIADGGDPPTAEIYQFTDNNGDDVPITFVYSQGIVVMQLPIFFITLAQAGPIVLTPPVGFPSKYRPYSEIDVPAYMRNNNARDLGIIRFTAAEEIEYYYTVTSNGSLTDFSANGTTGPIFYTTLSYVSKGVNAVAR